MIYKWAELPDTTAGSGAVNPLDRIEAIALLQRLATRVSCNGSANAREGFSSRIQRPITLTPNS